MNITLTRLIAAAFILAPTFALRAQDSASGPENAYDILGKTLHPIVSVFAPNEDGTLAQHALVLDAHLIAASKLPPELQGQAAHIAIRTPDALLVQAPIAGEILTVCRNADSFWATPGSKIQYLINQATTPDSSPSAADTPGKKKKKRKADAANIALAPMQLPIPAKELTFLPILFQVADAGSETIAGTPCHVLDVQLMPQLAKSLHAEDWTARLWITATYTITQLSLKGPDWSGTLAIDKLTFPDNLPAPVFQPTGPDVLHLTAAQFIDLLSRVGRK